MLPHFLSDLEAYLERLDKTAADNGLSHWLAPSGTPVSHRPLYQSATVSHPLPRALYASPSSPGSTASRTCLNSCRIWWLHQNQVTCVAALAPACFLRSWRLRSLYTHSPHPVAKIRDDSSWQTHGAAENTPERGIVPTCLRGCLVVRLNACV